MRIPLLLSFLATAALGGACVNDDTSSSELAGRGGNAGDDVGDDEECDCKLEGSDIGVVGAIAYAGDELIVFESWTPKVDSPGEYVGFTLSENAASIGYAVKASGEVYAATGTSWSHPGGDDGPDAAGISNVDFCDDDDDDDGDLPEIP